MSSLHSFVKSSARMLNATPVSGATDHFRFKAGDHAAGIKFQDGKDPTITLEVHSIPGAPEPRHCFPLEVPEPPLIELFRENHITRLGKMLRINKEYQSGDVAFDALIYIDSNNTPDAYIEHLLQSQEAREAIVALIQAGYDQITIDANARGGLVYATRSDAAGSSNTLLAQAAHLSRIADAIPPSTPKRIERRPDLGAKLLTFQTIIIMITFFLPRAFQHIWPIYGPRWSEPWWLSAMAWAAAILLLIPILRGSNRAFSRLLMNSFFLMFVIPSSMAPSLRAINALADTSEPQIIQATVLDKYRAHKNTSTYYHVTLDMHDGTSPEERNVSERDYARIPASGQVEVVMGAGALGWPWIARIGAR
jgi:hypothetical protein